MGKVLKGLTFNQISSSWKVTWCLCYQPVQDNTIISAQKTWHLLLRAKSDRNLTTKIHMMHLLFSFTELKYNWNNITNKVKEKAGVIVPKKYTLVRKCSLSLLITNNTNNKYSNSVKRSWGLGRLCRHCKRLKCIPQR